VQRAERRRAFAFPEDLVRKSLFASYIGSTGVMLAVLGAFPAAQAQPAAPPPTTTTNSDEIVITATGRVAALQEVPIAVSAVSNEQIKNAGITDVRNLQQVVSAYKVGSSVSNSANTTLYVRGIGTSGANPGFEAAVGVFVDGVFRSRAGAALGDLPPVDRIEVLRGPQGTLFGVNTSAGAVSVTTSKPQPEFGGYGSLEYGNFGELKSRVGITGPLTDKLALRLDAGSLNRNGITTEVNTGAKVNDRNRYFFRGQALFDNLNGVTFRLIADTAHADENCCTPVIVKDGTTSPALNLIAALQGRVGSPPVSAEQRDVAFTPGRPSLDKTDEYGVSGELNWQLNDIKLTSITAYRDWKGATSGDIDFNGADAFYDAPGGFQQFKTFTQEVRAQGQKGRLNWLGGLFYLNEKTDYKSDIKTGPDFASYLDVLISGSHAALGVPTGPTCNPAIASFSGCPSLFQSPSLGQSGATPLAFTNALVGAGFSPANAFAYASNLLANAPAAGQGQQNEKTHVDAESIAAFTHDEFAITDKLNLTLGARFTHETKDVTANLNSTAPACNTFQSSALVGTSGLTFNQVSALLFPSFSSVFLLACNPVANTVANGTYSGSKEENEWSGTASLKYKLTDSANVYVAYSRGYKAGGFNLDRSAFNFTPITTVKPSINDWGFAPEFTDNYEAGWKTQFPGRTTFNGAIFYEHIKGYQDNEFLGTNYKAFNIPSVISQGVELDLTTKPISNLTLQGSAVYNDAFYDGTFTVSTTPTLQTINDKTKLGGASKWTGAASASYLVPLPGGNLGLLFYIDGRYVSSYRNGPPVAQNPLSSSTTPGFGLLNGRVALGNLNKDWSLELWGENLLDKYVVTGVFNPPFETNVAGIVNEPRTYGVTVRAKF
jgi:iron complex outermembrane receptor protein